MGKGVALSIFLFILLPMSGFTEGTHQIQPFASAKGELCIDKWRNDFGFFDAAPEFRINIYVARNMEKINFGLGRITNPDMPVEVKYRLRAPNGAIVLGPSLVPQSAPGFINSYSEATIGPFLSAGGYEPIQYNPLTTGNYTLEFYYAPDVYGSYYEGFRIQFEFFDITVVDVAGSPIPGRVWSKAWQFNCGNVDEPPTDNRFWGRMYILSDDSIVTSINCNGFVGGTFSVSSNKTGCSNTGVISIDRQSRTGFHTYPQYKVFLSDPDSLVFPTGTSNPGISMPINITNDCASGSVDFGIKVTQDGIIEILIETDPGPGINPGDVKLTANVLANPGGNGYNIIWWNGNNGFGNPVPDGDSVTATIRFVHGITHLPMYDIEYNDNGYKVEVIRPPGTKPDIYWDDSLLPFGNTMNLNGCSDTLGCHLWTMETGDTNTINSWWYVASSIAPQVRFKVKRSPGMPSLISGDTSFCEGGITKTYTINREAGATSYEWTFSGTGAILNSYDTAAIISYADSATSGILSVSGLNKDCGNGPASILRVSFYPPPQVHLQEPDSVCYNEAAFRLTGGLPTGGEYRINGIPEINFDPASEGSGDHLVVYQYFDIHGCTNSDSSIIFVRNGRECEIMIRIPGAFTPNRDGLNDYFIPVALNIRRFSMNIYSRYGDLVFSSASPDIGWDGTCQGKPCPDGNYVYIIVYQSSFVPDKDSTLTGNVVLLR